MGEDGSRRGCRRFAGWEKDFPPAAWTPAQPPPPRAWQSPCYERASGSAGLGPERSREAGVRAAAVGLLVEEQRSDVAAAWKRAVEEQLGGEPALAFAVGPLLREMGLALRGDTPASAAPREGALRSAVLVRSGAAPSRVAREFKLLHRALWDTLRAAGRIVGVDERRAADEWLDEALAAALDRLERVRTRIDLLERGPSVVAPTPRPALTQRPPPLPAARAAVAQRPAPQRPAQRPPPLPAAVWTVE